MVVLLSEAIPRTGAKSMRKDDKIVWREETKNSKFETFHSIFENVKNRKIENDPKNKLQKIHAMPAEK